MNPIKYSDFFEQDGSIKELISQLKQVQETFRSMRDEVAQTAQQYKAGMGGMNPATDEGRQKIDELAKRVDQLYQEYKQLDSAMKSVRSNTEALSRIEEAQIRTAQERRDATRAQTQEVRAKMAAEKLDLEAVRQLTQADNLAAASYNKLAETYRLLKDRINAMTAATKDEIEARKQLQQYAGAIYEQMNKLQQATGKFQLQVGNYAKSWNGLNIATQQIVRELPNATMGFGMFMLSISNNIPILQDQIILAKQHRQALLAEAAAAEVAGDAEKARQLKMAAGPSVLKQMVSSLLSWQTLLIAGVTVLTMYGKQIGEFFSKMFSGKKTVDEAAEAMKRFNEAYKAIVVDGAKAATELRAMYEIATDLTAAEEDRYAAAKALQDLYPEIFGNYSREQIMVGDLKDKYDQLRDSIERTAMTQAAMQKLQEADAKYIDAQIRQNQLSQRAAASGLASPEYLSNRQKQIGGWTRPVVIGTNTTIEQAFTREERKMIEEYRKNNQDMEDAASDRKLIMKLMQDENLFLFGGKTGGGGGSRPKEPVDPISAILENYKYAEMAQEQFLDNMQDGADKEIAIAKNKFRQEVLALRSTQEQQKEIEDEIAANTAKLATARTQDEKDEIQKRINELEKARKIDLQGQTYINELIKEKEVALQLQIQSIRDKYRKKDYDAAVKAIGDEKKLADIQSQTLYASGSDEDKKALRIESLKNELVYWYQIVDLQREYISGTEEGQRQIAISEATIEKILAQLGALGTGSGNGDNKKGKWLPFIRNLGRVFSATVDSINEVVDAYIRMAEAAEEAAQRQVDAAEKVYDAELEAYKNGYANNVEFARKEMEQRRAQLAEAEALTRRYQRIQESIDTAMQVSSLVTAAANLWVAASKAGTFAPVVAAASIAAMFTSFGAAKIMAARVARQSDDVQYGEGMSEYLGYGGSHASGHDIDFGVTRDGRRRTVERGETVAVINKRNTSKYGYPMIAGIIDALNRGVFDQVYTRAFDGADGMRSPVTVGYDSPYFKGMSSDLRAIRRNAERRTVAASDKVIVEQYKNVTRTRRLS